MSGAPIAGARGSAGMISASWPSTEALGRRAPSGKCRMDPYPLLQALVMKRFAHSSTCPIPQPVSSTSMPTGRGHCRGHRRSHSTGLGGPAPQPGSPGDPSAPGRHDPGAAPSGPRDPARVGEAFPTAHGCAAPTSASPPPRAGRWPGPHPPDFLLDQDPHRLGGFEEAIGVQCLLFRGKRAFMPPHEVGTVSTVPARR